MGPRGLEQKDGILGLTIAESILSHCPSFRVKMPLDWQRIVPGRRIMRRRDAVHRLDQIRRRGGDLHEIPYV